MVENYAGDKKQILGYKKGSFAEETLERSVKSVNAPSIYHKKIWRIADVAEFLGCSKSHVYNLVSEEKIPRIKKGKFVYFIPDRIHNWVLEGN